MGASDPSYWDVFMVPAYRPDLKFKWARPAIRSIKDAKQHARAERILRADVRLPGICEAVESADPPPWFEELILDKGHGEIRLGLTPGTAFVIRVRADGQLRAETAVVGDVLPETPVPAWNRVRAAIWAAHSRVCDCGADLE